MRSQFSRFFCRLLFCIPGVFLLHGSAAAQHRDIFIASREDGQLAVVGEASVIDGTLVGTHVDGEGGVHYWTNNPGFASLSPIFLPDNYSPLPSNSDLSFSILSFALDGLPAANLWYWDGLDLGTDGDYADDVSFAPVESGAAFRMFRGPIHMQFQLSGIADGSDSDQPGFVLDTTSSGGGLHIHPGYEVFGPGATPPDEGVYLASIGLAVENLAASEPLYLVLRTSGTDAAAGFAARAWVDVALQVGDPLPGDFNTDGIVDAADYTVWRDGLGIDYTIDDYQTWRNNYGPIESAASSPAFQSESVPEPSSFIAFLSFGLLGGATTARRWSDAH